MPNCAACGGKTQGFKCAQCGTESPTHEPQHACGDELMQPKCQTCTEAQDNCMCVSESDDLEESTSELGEASA